MRILILGGTSFVGRAIVSDALEHDAEVTLFSRGKTGTDLFPGVERRIGDRDTGDYRALSQGEWDAVVDVSAYQTKEVDEAMDVLGDRVGRYVFISSHAVYLRTGVAPGSDENQGGSSERGRAEEKLVTLNVRHVANTAAAGSWHCTPHFHQSAPSHSFARG